MRDLPLISWTMEQELDRGGHKGQDWDGAFIDASVRPQEIAIASMIDSLKIPPFTHNIISTN